MSFLCATFSLVLGLYFLRNKVVISIIISLIYLGFLFYRFGKKKFLVFLSFFIAGVVVPRISLPINENHVSGFVVESRDNYFVFESKLHKYYVTNENNNFEAGDYLIIDGDISDLKITTYESRFDFKQYLQNKGIKKELKPTSIERKFKSFIKIHAFKTRFLSKFDQNTATLISAFLFNEKDYSSDLIKKADNSGIIYLFSLSGVYLNLIFSGLSYLFFIKFSKKASEILPFIILLPYAFFSFTKIGTLRVYAMYLLKFFNEHYFKRRKFSHIELVSILALFFISIDYNLVYQEAFYIGFLLSVLSPLMHNAIKCFSKKKQRILFPILIRLFILPLQIRDGSLDLLTYIKIVPIIPLNLLFLIIAMLSTVIPFYGFVNKIGGGLTWIIEKLDFLQAKVPFGNWSGIANLFIYAVFFIMLYLLESVRLKHAKCLCLTSLVFVLYSIFPLQEPLMNAVYFVNVGQGDSIIIKNHNKTVMIDTGGNKSFDMATESLIPFMNKKKITHIDALITTHDDFDHSGAKDSLINNFKVYNYISTPEQFPFKIGDLYFQNLNTFSFTEDNDKSLVLSLDFMNKKWLFMGDASTKVEKEIIKMGYTVDCDILKIGHHGSKSSTCEEFLKAASPKEAILSVGASNYYGHPNKEIIERLNKYNVKIRRTDEEGTISYFSLFA